MLEKLHQADFRGIGFSLFRVKQMKSPAVWQG